MALKFVPAADEVHRLQVGKDPEAKMFQIVAEQGHYGGRTVPTNTRQGTYALTPSGKFLASVNSNDPKLMAAMLSAALQAWSKMSRDERLGEADPSMVAASAARFERLYPEKGLVMRIVSRDLQRAETPSDWRAGAFNLDYAWFTEAEARHFLPTEPSLGQVHEVPRHLVSRLTRLHFVDNVRGQTTAFEESGVQVAQLRSTVTAVRGREVTLRLSGNSLASAKGRWSIDGSRDMNSASEQARGVDLQLLGKATFDLRSGRFVTFELVAAGKRWGSTQYNARRDDPGPSPIGYVCTKAGESPSERVAPAFWWAYPWR